MLHYALNEETYFSRPVKRKHWIQNIWKCVLGVLNDLYTNSEIWIPIYRFPAKILISFLTWATNEPYFASKIAKWHMFLHFLMKISIPAMVFRGCPTTYVWFVTTSTWTVMFPGFLSFYHWFMVHTVFWIIEIVFTISVTAFH